MAMKEADRSVRTALLVVLGFIVIYAAMAWQSGREGNQPIVRTGEQLVQYRGTAAWVIGKYKTGLDGQGELTLQDGIRVMVEYRPAAGEKADFAGYDVRVYGRIVTPEQKTNQKQPAAVITEVRSIAKIPNRSEGRTESK